MPRSPSSRMRASFLRNSSPEPQQQPRTIFAPYADRIRREVPCDADADSLTPLLEFPLTPLLSLSPLPASLGAPSMCPDAIRTELKKERDTWTTVQTNTLVAHWKDNFHELKDTPRSRQKWAEICSRVNAVGKQKSITQCKNKIRNLSKVYKEAKAKNNSTEPEISPILR